MPRKLFTKEEVRLVSGRYSWNPDNYWITTFRNAGITDYYGVHSDDLIVQVYRELIVASVCDNRSFNVGDRIFELLKEEQCPPPFEPGDEEEET